MFCKVDRQLLRQIHDLLLTKTRSDPGLVDMARRVGVLEEQVMSLKDDLENALKLVDEKTTALSARIDGIVGQLQNPNITPAEKDAVLAHLSAIGDSLDAMAKSPTNPVPEPTPLPPV